MKTKNIASGLHLIAVLMLAVVIVAPCPGQEQAGEPPKKEAKEKASPITAVVGGRIMTVTNGIVRDGTILIQDGKILAVGQGLTIPKDATVIDAAGMIVTPGFIALNSNPYGISGAVSGESQIKDALNPFDRNMQYLLGVGITTICTGGGGRGGGAASFNNSPQLVLKMSFGELDGMFVKENPFYMVGGASFRGGLNAFNWRDTLKKAKDYVQAQAAQPAAAAQQRQGQQRGQRGGIQFQGGGTQRQAGQRQQRAPVSEDILKLVRGEVALRTDASTVDQIRDAIALAEEFGYRLILEGAGEAWLMADELGSVVECAIIGPRQIADPQKGREETTGGTMELSKHLEQAGVPFAIKPQGGNLGHRGGMIGASITGLPIEAMFAVSGGCDVQTALEGITIVPARMMGLADRLGSIEVGKDADLLIMDGHPLDYKTYVKNAVVNGNVVYDRAMSGVYPVFDRALFEKADDKVDPKILKK